jgi:hypothetical protein
MRAILYLIFIVVLNLSSCIGLKRVHRLIDQKDEFIWTGTEGAKNYSLIVDNADGIWFTGKIIIESQDTLYIKGFEKGSNHPTTIKHSGTDINNNTSMGHFFIWTQGYTADTVRINNKHDSIPQLPIELILFKTQKSK